MSSEGPAQMQPLVFALVGKTGHGKRSTAFNSQFAIGFREVPG